MDLTTWLIYVSVTSILIFTPGPSALLCISDGLKYGKKRSVATVLGGATAAMILMSISAAGLGAILVASEKLFFILKNLGAVYLIYIGLQSWRHTGSIAQFRAEQPTEQIDIAWLTLFKKGFMVGISNPKDLLFFIALFPGFIDTSSPHVEQYVILALTWFILDCSFMFMYSVIGNKCSRWLFNHKNMRRFNRVVGAIFISLGSTLAITSGASR
ncbi:LysE family translocator [Vibrio sp.]|nr:LysE family translocator [Vibrio sp.]